MEKTVTHWDDIGYTCVYELHPYGVVMDFRAYAIAATTGEGQRLYHRKDYDDGLDFSEDGLNDAQVFLHGSIKWDGCSHMWFDEQDNGTMLHLCGRSCIDNLRELLKRMFDLAAQTIPRWDAKVAE